MAPVPVLLCRIFLHAGHQVLEGGRIARAAVHRERKLRIELILDGAAERGVGGVRATAGASVTVTVVFSPPTVSFSGKPSTGGVVDGDVLLEQAIEAFGDDLDVVWAGLQRLRSNRFRVPLVELGGLHPGIGIGGGNLALATPAPLGSVTVPWMPPPPVLWASSD